MNFSQARRYAQNQHGIALLVVLLLLATLSVIAIAMTEELRFAVGRSVASQSRGQGLWYAASAESFAKQIIAEQYEATGKIDTLDEPWLGQQIFPIPGGRIVSTLSDATACLNVNSLVALDAEEINDAENKTLLPFEALFEAIGIDDFVTSSLLDTLVDWIDEDDNRENSGAEDGTYAQQQIPYRAGNTLLADLSELRAVAYYSREVVQVLEPFLCALPNKEPLPVNVNLLTEEQAPVLFAALEGVLSMEEVENLITQRPSTGYPSVQVFFEQSSFQGIETESLAARVDVWSKYIKFEAKIDFGTSYVDVYSLLEVSEGGVATLLTRRFGESN